MAATADAAGATGGLATGGGRPAAARPTVLLGAAVFKREDRSRFPKPLVFGAAVTGAPWRLENERNCDKIGEKLKRKG